jgi:hypothetical protein
MNKVNIIFSFLTIGFVLLINSCATIMKGTSQDISINSNPVSAKFVVKTTGGIEMFSGSTPGSVKLPKKKEYIVTITMQGFKDANISITQSFESWTIGNVICGGIIGLIVDAANGAMWKLEPDVIMVTLATAYNQHNEIQHYAVFRALDDKGEIRSLAVPLIKDGIVLSN